MSHIEHIKVLQKTNRKKPDRAIVQLAGDEPRLYQKGTFVDKEANRVRRAPVEFVDTSTIKMGLKHEGRFEP